MFAWTVATARGLRLHRLPAGDVVLHRVFGDHYVADIIAGVAVALIGWALAGHLTRPGGALAPAHGRPGGTAPPRTNLRRNDMTPVQIRRRGAHGSPSRTAGLRGASSLPALRRRRLPRALRGPPGRRLRRSPASLHVDVERVRRARPHRRVPLLRHRLHEPAPAPSVGAGPLLGDVERQRYLDEEQGRVETFTESLDARGASSCRPERMLDVGCHVGTFLEHRRAATASRSRASSPRAGRRSRARRASRRGAPRRGRGRAAAGGRLRRRDDVGRRSSTCPIPRSTCAPSTRAAARRHLRAVDDGRRRALPARRRLALAVVHADAPRVLLAPHAGRDAAPRGLPHRRRRAPTCAASGSRTWPRASTRTCRRWRGRWSAGCCAHRARRAHGRREPRRHLH